MGGNSEMTTHVNIDTDKKVSLININSVVVIPALNPIPNLISLVQGLLEWGVPQLIIVNDGSDSSYNYIFCELEKYEHCIVLTHEVNRGKGRALKTAFSYFLEHYSYYDGVVTADADGQHKEEDICRICEKLSLKQNSLILGVRNFREDNVPKRSYMGNMVTSRIFQLLYGTYLNDTQTGLRGLPSNELPWIAQLKGERYDYEINMLIKARRRNLNFTAIPIKTVYFDNNSGSHYKTFKDSVPIFLCLISGLLQFSGATIISGCFDVISFFILNSFLFSSLSAPVRILLSTVVARAISSIFNYLMNRRLIFDDMGKLRSSALRYYILCVIQIFVSYVLVYTASLYWKVNESIIKLLVDIILGFGSYQVQLRWVFQNRCSIDTSFSPGGIGNLSFRSFTGGEDERDK